MFQIPYRPLDHIHQSINASLKDAFGVVLSSNSYILGSHVESFEKEFAKYIGVEHAIGVGNGHDALLLSLKALGIGPGDEVVIPAHTFFATALAVFNSGAKPVLIDVENDSCNIDISNLNRHINNRTRAIVPVHLYGNPCDMDPLLDAAKNLGLPVVEDFAQAHGALYKGRSCGSMGLINATSFYPVKNLGALGDGGMVTTQSVELATTVRKLRNYGGLKRDEYDLPGYNSRLDALQAAFLKIKLPHLDEWNRQRRKIADLYVALLKNCDDLRLPLIPEGNKAVFHVFAIRTKRRNELKDWLGQQGIETLVHYPVPIYRQPAAKRIGMADGDFPITEDICKTELSLPIYPGLSDDSVEYICKQIILFFKKGRRKTLS